MASIRSFATVAGKKIGNEGQPTEGAQKHERGSCCSRLPICRRGLVLREWSVDSSEKRHWSSGTTSIELEEMNSPAP
ncbi:hypothetical protein NPIL_42361 [Nephila pilipes]|uniref:Uncharacterized protein n=1 Tax=Nephila pilipes TaxID=299642 RepID=A0A8X6MEW1_NEPPI|nr:hypothetical protein NPIL_42361 [Nephila pilipes]